MKREPVILLPFIIIAFLESLALEFIYFSPRRPLSRIAGPVIRKLFGENFLHYPDNLLLLPKLFYYAQVVIYIFIGVLLTAVSVNIIRNIRMGFPLKLNALIKNNFKRYLSFMALGVIVALAVFFLKQTETFIFTKLIRLLAKHLPQALLKLFPYLLTLVLFVSNIILQTFLVLAIPVMVIKKKGLFKALGESIILGLRNFFSIFLLIFLPFLVYLPITLLKTGMPNLMARTFPEITLYITIGGIILAVFAECFVVVCVTQFLLEKEQ